MIRHPLRNPTSIYTLTAKLTDLPKDVVEDIVKHEFRYALSWFKRPTSPRLLIPYMGSFTPRLSPLKRKLKYLIEQMREDPSNQELKDEFRFWWNCRKIVLNDYYVKVNKKRKRNAERIKRKNEL